MKTIDRCCTKKSQKPSDFEEQYKLNRVQTSKELLERYKLEGDGFFYFILTVDETWVGHFIPETKRQSQ